MALPSTRMDFRIELSHVDRGVQASERVVVARHPSESGEHVILRVLAYCLFHEEGLAFGPGISDARVRNLMAALKKQTSGTHPALVNPISPLSLTFPVRPIPLSPRRRPGTLPVVSRAFLSLTAADVAARVQAIATGGTVVVRVGDEVHGYRNVGVDLPRGRRSAAKGRRLRRRGGGARVRGSDSDAGMEREHVRHEGAEGAGTGAGVMVA